MTGHGHTGTSEQREDLTTRQRREERQAATLREQESGPKARAEQAKRREQIIANFLAPDGEKQKMEAQERRIRRGEWESLQEREDYYAEEAAARAAAKAEAEQKVRDDWNAEWDSKAGERAAQEAAESAMWLKAYKERNPTPTKTPNIPQFKMTWEQQQLLSSHGLNLNGTYGRGATNGPGKMDI
jgi:hypothetical protein